MSFQQSADSWRAKMHLSGARLPVLVGLTAVVLCIVVGAGRMLFDAASAEGFALQQSASAEQEGAVADEATNTPVATIRVHVGGSVAVSGVYEVAEGARVLDAIEAAGGFAEGAARDALNLARVVNDGEQIVVPSEAELAAAQEQGVSSSASTSTTSSTATNGKVNINTASVDQLDTLPGVGVSTAEKIIADREANGPFKTIEDLKRVSGIGDKKYAALADAICVG